MQRSTLWAANSSRPLASPALSSGPVAGPPPREIPNSERKPTPCSRCPLPSSSRRTLPAPFRPPKPLPKKLPAKRKREPGPLRALLCLVSPHWGSRCRTKSRRPGGEAARPGGVGAPRGPGSCAQMPAPGLERVGVGRQEKTLGLSSAFFRTRPCSSLYLGPDARRGEGGGAEPQARGEACESCHGRVGGGRRPGRSARVSVSTDAAGPPRHGTGGKGRRAGGGLEVR